MKVFPECCINALKYYNQQADAYKGMPEDNAAYNTLNCLFYGDTVSERARVREGKRLNPDFFDKKYSLLVPALCSDLIKATILGGEGAPARTIFRVARLSDAEAMKRAGMTLSFTSASKNGFLEAYADKDGLVLLELQLPANAPRAEYDELIPTYSKPEEAEVLLPPWLSAEFEECELSESELQIEDHNGKPPVGKYRVQLGSALEPPNYSAECQMEMHTAEAGKGVLFALANGREPEPDDEREYLAWKKALLAEIVTESSLCSLSKVYAESMESVRYIAGDVLDDPLDATAGRAWIEALLGVDKSSNFAERINKLPDERVAHTVTTFLLGNWLRDKLHLGFNKLPRIFSRNNKVGDPFPFFWTVVCLGHDIGYIYENDKRSDVIQTLYGDTTADYRVLREHLKLSDGKTLLELTRGDLIDCGLTDAECEWAEQSIQMARKYYRYRLKHNRVDHGIAGGLVLYDVLRGMAAKRSLGKTVSRHAEPGMTGFAAANSRRSRFLSCAILVSLTIARHNMWVADENNPFDIKNNLPTQYRAAGLDGLIVNGDSNKLSIHEPLDQLLFFLDYLDTIDPFKAFYLRSYEKASDKTSVVLEVWREFVIQRIRLGFCRGKCGGSHRIRFRFDTEGFVLDPSAAIESFSKNVRGMTGWLLLTQGSASTAEKLDLYLPVTEQRSRCAYAYGVTEDEILDICFYQGIPDSSRPGAFFQLANAYQTLNLLMMDRLDGERIRIGREHQRPSSIYIRNWKRTLAVFRSIFSAMCKCHLAFSQEDRVLHRMDRRVNAEQMCEKGRTIAFTSATKSMFLTEFLEGKIEPVIETIRLSEQIPAFDYQEILKEDYAFTEEAEVLLPPFAKLCSPPELPLTFAPEAEEGSPLCFDLTLESMDFPASSANKDALIQTLNQLQDKAAEILDSFVFDHDSLTTTKGKDVASYLAWKHTFQELVSAELSEIYRKRIPASGDYCL